MSIYSKIAGTGSCLPRKVVTNQALAAELAAKGIETSDEWIRTRTGIAQRYLASGGESTLSMACAAARDAIDSAGLTAADIDLIVVATTSPDAVFPSTACRVQAHLGCSKAAAFDIQAVCSGFVYATAVADSMIRSGAMKTVLVIGSETLSRLVDWTDRGTCVLFGDGAAAAILVASDVPGIYASEIAADGTKGEQVLGAMGHFEGGCAVGDPLIRMDGKAVFRSAVEKMTESARSVLAKAGLKPSDVDVYIPHQANLRIMSAVASKLGIPDEKVVKTVCEHGNTSAASVPLALDAAIARGWLKRGQVALLQGVGGGFTWGSVVFKY